MQNMSSVFAVIVKKIPSIFSKESINKLVMDNKIELIHARESLTAVDLYKETQEKSTSTASTVSKMQKLGFYANVKFEAMLEAAKEDERLLFDEFTRVDNERNQIISKIASKKEGDVNVLLKAAKTLPGVDEAEIDDLIKLSVRVEDID